MIRSRRFVGAAALAAALLFAPEVPRAEEGPEVRELVVYGVSATDGTYARPNCRESPVLSEGDVPFARQVAAYRRLVRRTAERAGTADPLALHLGDSTHPGPVGRFLLSREKSGARRLVRLLGTIPWTAHTLGNREIGLRRTVRHTFADAARRGELPLRAANLVCSDGGGAGALCTAVGRADDARTYDVVRRGDLRLLVVSVVDPDVRGVVAPSAMTGIDLLDPAAFLERRLPEMREAETPDLVVLQYHSADPTPLSDLTELTRKVDGIDLLFTNKQLADSAGSAAAATNGYIRAPGSGSYIVPVGRGSSIATVTRIGVDRTSPPDREWSVEQIDSRAVDTSEVPPDPKVRGQLERLAEPYCRKWGRPIAPQRPLSEPFDRSDFATFTANVLRTSTRSEVGLLNDGSIRNDAQFPLRDKLTYADVYTALPFENPVVVVELPGSALRRVAGALGSEARAVGLDRESDGLRVNGRRLRDDQSYRVATNQYVAEGGDGLLPTDAIESSTVFKPDWSGRTPSVAETVIHYAREPRGADDAASDSLSPTAHFPDLRHRLRWTLVGSVDASFDQVTVTNPTVANAPAYSQSQLQVKPTQQIRLDAEFQANADSQNHGWDNDLTVKYALARVANGGDDSFSQTQDLIRAKTRYNYSGFRSRLGSPWWGPMPTAELQFETEFDRPEGRDWHKLELTGIVGAIFQITDDFEVKLGVDLRGDFNRPDEDPDYGLAAAYQLSRFTVVELFGRSIQFQSDLEFFFNDPFDEQIYELRTTNRLFISILEDLDVTSTFSAFLYRSGQVGALGQNTEVSVGLNYRWDRALQTYGAE